jgi:pimeloyl-ACP methyl ester carboxylesterase
MKPSLVFLHGFGEDARIWDDFLTSRFAEYDLQIPNYAAWSDCISIADYACKIEASLPKNQRFVLIGHSMGGYIALEFVKQFPDRIHGVVMLHSTFLPDSAEKQLQRDKTASFIQEHGSETFIRSFVSNLFAPQFVESNQVLMRQLADRYVTIPQEGLIASTLAMKVRNDMQMFVQSTETPFLFVFGDLDPLISINSIVEGIAGKDQHKYVILSGVAHQGCYEAPEETFEAINQFVNELHV